MNTNRFVKLSSQFALVAGFVAAAASAHAGGGVYWSVNVATPVGVSTSVSNTRHGVYGPAPVVYAPAPVYVEQRPVYVEPRPIYVPAPVVYEEPRHYCPPRWGWHHRHHHEDQYAWNDGWRGGERIIVPRGGYDRDDGDRGDRGGRDGWRRDR